MKALRQQGSQEVFSITVGDSIVFVPPGYNPGEIFGSFIWDRTQGEVPISQISISLMSWLRLTEKVYQKLIEIGQPEIAKQILPRGGCNRNISR